jgi:hypothetical protein
VQVDLARAEGGLQSARAFVFETIGDLWATALAGDVPSIDQRARFQLATQQVMRAAVGQHVYFGDGASRRYAMARLGIDQPTTFL